MQMTPEFDGVTHINIFSKGKTELGRLLSNFAHTPFKFPVDGKFASIEAYWYWEGLRISCIYDVLPEELEKLRGLYGWPAKKYGKELMFKYVKRRAWTLEQESEFKGKIKQAFRVKLKHNPEIQEKLIESTLPFTHYYVFGEATKDAPAHHWQVEFWERMRERLARVHAMKKFYEPLNLTEKK